MDDEALEIPALIVSLQTTQVSARKSVQNFISPLHVRKASTEMNKTYFKHKELSPDPI